MSDNNTTILNKNPNQLLKENSGLIHYVLKNIPRNADYYEDAFQEASIAFYEAIYNFNPEKYPNLNFITHVRKRMQWALGEYFKSKKFSQGRGGHNRTEDKYSTISWDAATDEDGRPLGKVLLDEKSIISILKDSRWNKVQQILNKYKYKFTEIEWKSFIWYYEIEDAPFKSTHKSTHKSPTLQEIGDYLGHSREWIRRNLEQCHKIIRQTPELLEVLEDFKETIDEFQ